MLDIDPKLRNALDAFYQDLRSQEMSADLRSFSPAVEARRNKLLQPLLTSAAGLVAIGAIVFVGLITHGNPNPGPSRAPAGVLTPALSPSPAPTPTPTTPPTATPNPAFPGTALTLSGANTGDVSVTALRCSNKNQTGDTVVEGTVAGSHFTIQFLNPAVFGKPPFQTPSPGHPGQPYVSLWVWQTDSATAPNWGTFATTGVTYGTTSIEVNVDLPALARAAGTTHVTGTLACSS